MSDEANRKFVKPACAGALIPDPAHNGHLPQDGAEVSWDHYWIARLARGEIEIVDPVTAADPSEPSAA